MDETLRKQSYKQILTAFGNYQGLNFQSLSKTANGAVYEIYRFKGHFDKNAEVEVRAVLDADYKLAGFFVTPWKDDL